MRQRWGQNYLTDRNLAEKIVNSAEISPDSLVLEIGPGKGILTDLILKKAGSLILVEIDRALCGKLKLKYQNIKNLEIINEDFLKFDLSSIKKPFILVSNLPYNSATAIIERFLPSGLWHRATIMVQKEIGERIVSDINRKSYNAFSILCQHYADFKILLTCGPEAFSPCPKVDSVVLMAENKKQKPLGSELMQIMKSCFQERRKMAINTISKAVGVSKHEAAAAFQDQGIPLNSRPENLSLKAFQGLTSYLKKCRIRN
jgi:16S rRNA (adenine1518-N6/adenine1519-N6)-dimethyltransferase